MTQSKKHIAKEDYHKIAMTDCFICRIISGNPLVPDPQIIYEDEKVVAFLNQFPTQEGYVLVCPKKHVERYENDLTAEEWQYLQEKVHQISKAISKAMRAMRMYVVLAGTPQRNSHVHVHVCPCPHGTPLEKQQLAAMWFEGGGEYLDIPKERMEEIAKKIRENL